MNHVLMMKLGDENWRLELYPSEEAADNIAADYDCEKTTYTMSLPELAEAVRTYNEGRVIVLTERQNNFLIKQVRETNSECEDTQDALQYLGDVRHDYEAEFGTLNEEEVTAMENYIAVLIRKG